MREHDNPNALIDQSLVDRELVLDLFFGKLGIAPVERSALACAECDHAVSEEVLRAGDNPF